MMSWEIYFIPSMVEDTNRVAIVTKRWAESHAMECTASSGNSQGWRPPHYGSCRKG